MGFGSYQTYPIPTLPLPLKGREKVGDWGHRHC